MANFCAKCGGAVDPNTGVCRECTAPTVDAPTEAAQKNDFMAKIKALPKKTLMSLGATSLAAVILIAFCFFIFFSAH